MSTRRSVTTISQESDLVRPSHQARPNKLARVIVQLTPQTPSWSPPYPPQHPPMPYPPQFSYPYTCPPPPCLPPQMRGMPMIYPHYPYGTPPYPTWGTSQTSVFDRLAPLVQDRLSPLDLVIRDSSSKAARILTPKSRPIQQMGIGRELPNL